MSIQNIRAYTALSMFAVLVLWYAWTIWLALWYSSGMRGEGRGSGVGSSAGRSFSASLSAALIAPFFLAWVENVVTLNGPTDGAFFLYSGSLSTLLVTFTLRCSELVSGPENIGADLRRLLAMALLLDTMSMLVLVCVFDPAPGQGQAPQWSVAAPLAIGLALISTVSSVSMMLLRRRAEALWLGK
jgi:hypothetical protein